MTGEGGKGKEGGVAEADRAGWVVVFIRIDYHCCNSTCNWLKLCNCAVIG